MMAEMNRRLLLQRAALLVGTSAMLNACDLFSGDTRSDFALTDRQRGLLTALADTIIPETDTPGALKVGVPEMVAAMLRDWAAPANRDAMLAALERVAELAGDLDFAKLDPARRSDLLAPHDIKAFQDLPPEQQGKLKLRQRPRKTDEGYATLKELIVVLYYFSEEALTEELRYAHNPGRWDPSVPLTTDSRNEGGFGLF